MNWKDLILLSNSYTSDMANTYTQIHLQLVFAVQNRWSVIQPSWKDELYKYITAIIQNNKHKVIIINGMPDHVHILIGMRPIQSLSELMKQVKGDSSAWINKNKLIPGRFSWQEGYGAFAYSKSHLPRIINYIKNQEKHHLNRSLRSEYQGLLDEQGVDYDIQYIFHDME